MRKLLFVAFLVALSARAETPETVIGMYYPKPGKQEEMLRILKNYGAVLTRLNLIVGTHQLYRAETEGGNVYFVDIFTWRDENIPDNAPPEVKTVWAEMRANTDRLDFASITPVSDAVDPEGSGAAIK